MNIYFKQLTEKTDKSGEAPVFLFFYYNKYFFKFFTKEKCEPKHWDDGMRLDKKSGKQIRMHTGKFKRSLPGYQEAQDYLDTLEEKTRKAYREYMQKGIIPTPAMLKSELLPESPAVEEVPVQLDFITLFDDLIAHNKIKCRTEDTMRTFKTVRRALYNFNANYHKLDIQGYTLDVHNKLLDYWLNVLNIHPNTMATRIKKLKVFFRYCTEDRNINLHPDWKRIKANDISPDKIFLTWEELEMMRTAKLRTSLAHVRDAFLFSCYTSLRHSDLFKFNHEHIVDKGSYKVISFVAKKTARSKVNRLEIALSNFALELIEKYKDRQLKALPVIVNQKMNSHLKEIGKLVGINSIVERVFYKNGVPNIEIVPKYECITTYTARHTFATQSLIMGMDVAVLQKILGHADIKTTMIYAKIVDEYKHKVMLDSWNGNKARR